jgi:outer membrane receptor protein involved in Fe transport
MVLVLGLAAPLGRGPRAQVPDAEPPLVLTPGDVEPEARESDELSLSELQALDLEHFLKANVDVGNLTKSGLLTTPASVTTITEEDIRLAPARNINDLLEIYVPGVNWVIHSETAHPGIRGIISDRNYKFLLLVNGKVMNQRAHAGVVTELENWDLSDIAQIDVLRGPGSVTYGPGAIAGVISITTKNARKANGTSLRTTYVAPYGAAGVAFDHAFKNDRFEVYLYASRVGTPGVTAPTFQVDPNNNFGYLYQTPAFPDKPAPYFGDFNGQPQYKAYLDVRFLKEWTFWARYTNSGQNLGTTSLGTANQQNHFPMGLLPDGSPVWGPPVNQKSLSARQITATLANEHRFGRLTLKPMVTLTSQDYRRRLWETHAFTATDPPQIQEALADPENLRAYAQKFSESEVFLRMLANLQFGRGYQAALGAEYSYEYFGPAWGDGPRDFRMGDNNDIISGTDSQAYGYPQYNGVDPAKRWLMTSGWGSHTGSVFGELNLQFHPIISLMLSGRIDKNDRSAVLYSPRVALVLQPNEHNVLKLIVQRAQRMNTAEQLLYQQIVNHTVAAPEQLRGAEASYAILPLPSIVLSAAGFYNELTVIGFNTNQEASLVVGNLKLYGTELEAAYSSKRWRVGLSHSFVKQLSWHLGAGATQSGISYADFNQPTRDDPNIVIHGYGNDLANWANNATKLFVHFRWSSWLLFHADGQIFWGEQGEKDALSALDIAAQGSSRQADIDRSVQAVRDAGAYGYDIRVNASAHVALSPALSIAVYGMNLCRVCSNQRYGYDAGLTRAAPVRSIFVREPLTIGTSASYAW